MRFQNLIDLLEIHKITDNFRYNDLLTTDYFKKYKQVYIDTLGTRNFNFYRNYKNLIKYLDEIYEYNKEYSDDFAKRLKTGQNDWRNCETIFSEIIVCRFYIRLVYQGIIKIHKKENNERDLILELADGSLSYYEKIFGSVPPTGKYPASPRKEKKFQDLKTLSNRIIPYGQKNFLKNGKTETPGVTNDITHLHYPNLRKPCLSKSFKFILPYGGEITPRVNPLGGEKLGATPLEEEPTSRRRRCFLGGGESLHY